MKYALVSDERREALPGLSGQCPGCGAVVVAKCGETRVHHWAHKAKRLCDTWWENETQWHRDWKNHFPSDWQEVVHVADDGERHIADVKTGDGWVIEFQHSHITPDERRSREAFYPKLIWVLDGTRRKRDQKQLVNAWRDGTKVQGSDRLRKAFTLDSGLLREWTGNKVPIFVDLGEEDLWMLYPHSPGMTTYVERFPRVRFIDCHRGTGADVGRRFEQFIDDIPRLIAFHESPRPVSTIRYDILQSRRTRRRFRF